MRILVHRVRINVSDIEMQRLNVLHWAIYGLWQTNIRVPIPYPAIKIIDIGCGSGIWSREVAEALPRSQVMGVDLSPTFLPEEPGRPHPENLCFEVSRGQTASNCRLTISILVFNILMLVSTLSQVALLLAVSTIGSLQSGRCFVS